MSDQRSGGDVTAEAGTADETAEHTVDEKPSAGDTGAGAAPAKSPSPRPRSAASRARRIGGAAAPTPVAKSDKQSDDQDETDSSVPAPASSSPATTGKVSTAKPPSTKRDAVAGADADAEHETDGDEDGHARRLTVALPGWAVWTPAVLFAAVAVVFLTLFIVARVGDDSDTTSSTTRQEVLASAKTCLATLNTYRYDKIDAAEAAGVKCTTAKLTSDYRKTVTTVIRAKAPALKAVQLAKINSAGIESVTKNGKQWTVLAYGQLNITTSQQKQGRVDPFAVVARLQQVDGKWLLSKIDTVSSFSS